MNLSRVGTANGAKRRGQEYVHLGAGSGYNFIRGFDVEFTNGDHHLERFKIVPSGRGFRVYLNDNNLDDPVPARIDYGTIDQNWLRNAPH